MKTLKLFFVALIAMFFVPFSSAQDKPSAAIFGIYVNEVDLHPEIAADLFRIELNKVNQYHVLDKLDLLEVEKQGDLEYLECYGRLCLQKAGEQAKVDYAVSGSIESLGKRVVISLKVYNVRKGVYEKTTSLEFIDNMDEVQRMVRIVMHEAYNIESRPEVVEMLSYYEEPPESPRSLLRNTGPRMGIAYIGGETGEVLQMAEADGGYDVIPIMSQFGYQFEKSYISSGNFQALVEGMVMMTGIEQNMFIPSLTLLNGFRSSKSGWEIGFGPSVNIKKIAEGFYTEIDGKEVWHLARDYDITSENIVKRVDKRGNTELSASWIWAVGKTFRSGYMNIPLNAYFSHGKYGWYTGVSLGFNIQK